MKTKLLKKLRSRYRWKYKDGQWTIYILQDFPIAWTETTHKAVDIMTTPMLAIYQVIKWYGKVYRLHGTWGKYTEYTKSRRY